MQEILTGQYHHSLDAKGRLIVPAKFRDILGSQFKIGVSLDDCLTVYSKEGFEAFYQKLNALPSNQDKVRHLVRFFMGNTMMWSWTSRGVFCCRSSFGRRGTF